MANRNDERPAEQRDACARACVDRGLGPAEVVRLAAAGELEPGLAPFEVPPATVSSWAARLRKRRTGEVRTKQSATPAAERIAALRDRLLNMAEHELARLERQQRSTRAAPCSSCGELTKRAPAEVSGEELRQIARALREAAAILPAPRAPGAQSPNPSASPTGDGRPARPGTRDQAGDVAGGATRGGLAGAILADMREPATAPDESPSTSPNALEAHESAAESNESAQSPESGEHGRAQLEHEHEPESADTTDPVRAADAQVAAHLEQLERTLDAARG